MRKSRGGTKGLFPWEIFITVWIVIIYIFEQDSDNYYFSNMGVPVNDASVHWFVMRDLKRHNAKDPAYRMLAAEGIEVFTPMIRKLMQLGGRKLRIETPFIPDLLFVRDSRQRLDPIVLKTPTLQYRFIRGEYKSPMVVPDREMDRFLHAVRVSEQPRFFQTDEIRPEMYGRRIRVIGGPLDGYEGHLLSLRGSRTKRLLVELPHYLTAAVEITPDLIEILES